MGPITLMVVFMDFPRAVVFFFSEKTCCMKFVLCSLFFVGCFCFTFKLLVVGCCWLLLVVVGCCWLLWVLVVVASSISKALRDQQLVASSYQSLLPLLL